MRRQLVSSNEAEVATHQHSRPCGDCPWRRDALPGWLGGASPAHWISLVLSDEQVPCHTLTGAQCAGAAIFRGNICKLPRDRGNLRLKADREAVFSHPQAFLDHHS